MSTAALLLVDVVDVGGGGLGRGGLILLVAVVVIASNRNLFVVFSYGKRALGYNSIE